MKKILKWILIFLVPVLIFWGLLTLWVEKEGPYDKLELGIVNAPKKALIVYDPDPFYNLDQQVCETFGTVLADNNYKVTIATVIAAKEITPTVKDFDLYVFCTNTYNWYPDWAVKRFIEQKIDLTNQNVIAITLGAGATSHSQKVLETLIENKKGKLIDSKSFWLLKPNDESQSKTTNVKEALEMTKSWALEITNSLK